MCRVIFWPLEIMLPPCLPMPTLSLGLVQDSSLEVPMVVKPLWSDAHI